jgi:hypothetical protein
VFNYAHLPSRFKPQRRIADDDLPPPEVKLDILQATTERLTDAGWLYIGMDHFARPDDELALAQRDGTLYRNFQGYSTHAECDLIGLGVTSIGKVANTYGQNRRELDSYYEDIDNGRLPVFRGIELNRDDELRRDVITRLICHFRLDFADVERRWNIDFADYFATSLPKLDGMVRDGLLEVDSVGIRVLPKGRLLIRNICMAFDAYLARPSRGRSASPRSSEAPRMGSTSGIGASAEGGGGEPGHPAGQDGADLPALFRRVAAAQRDAPAIFADSLTWSYSALDAATDDVAASLAARGYLARRARRPVLSKLCRVRRRLPGYPQGRCRGGAHQSAAEPA